MNVNGHHPTPVASLELIQAWLDCGMPTTLPEFLAEKERKYDYANTRAKAETGKDVAGTYSGLSKPTICLSLEML